MTKSARNETNKGKSKYSWIPFHRTQLLGTKINWQVINWQDEKWILTFYHTTSMITFVHYKCLTLEKCEFKMHFYCSSFLVILFLHCSHRTTCLPYHHRTINSNLLPVSDSQPTTSNSTKKEWVDPHFCLRHTGLSNK